MLETPIASPTRFLYARQTFLAERLQVAPGYRFPATAWIGQGMRGQDQILSMPFLLCACTGIQANYIWCVRSQQDTTGSVFWVSFWFAQHNEYQRCSAIFWLETLRSSVDVENSEALTKDSVFSMPLGQKCSARLDFSGSPLNVTWRHH